MFISLNEFFKLFVRASQINTERVIFVLKNSIKYIMSANFLKINVGGFSILSRQRKKLRIQLDDPATRRLRDDPANSVKLRVQLMITSSARF